MGFMPFFFFYSEGDNFHDFFHCAPFEMGNLVNKEFASESKFIAIRVDPCS